MNTKKSALPAIKKIVVPAVKTAQEKKVLSNLQRKSLTEKTAENIDEITARAIARANGNLPKNAPKAGAPLNRKSDYDSTTTHKAPKQLAALVEKIGKMAPLELPKFTATYCTEAVINVTPKQYNLIRHHYADGYQYGVDLVLLQSELVTPVKNAELQAILSGIGASLKKGFDGDCLITLAKTETEKAPVKAPVKAPSKVYTETVKGLKKSKK